MPFAGKASARSFPEFHVREGVVEVGYGAVLSMASIIPASVGYVEKKMRQTHGVCIPTANVAKTDASAPSVGCRSHSQIPAPSSETSMNGVP